MIIKLAGMRQQHIPWREQIDLDEVDATSDEYGWDEWLEMAEGGNTTSSVQRVATPIPNFNRYNERPVKVAAATNWDNEFAAAQSHAREVMAKLGS